MKEGMIVLETMPPIGAVVLIAIAIFAFYALIIKNPYKGWPPRS